MVKYLAVRIVSQNNKLAKEDEGYFMYQCFWIKTG